MILSAFINIIIIFVGLVLVAFSVSTQSEDDSVCTYYDQSTVFVLVVWVALIAGCVAFVVGSIGIVKIISTFCTLC